MIFMVIVIGLTILWTYAACVAAGDADRREGQMLKDYFENKNKNDDISID